VGGIGTVSSSLPGMTSLLLSLLSYSIVVVEPIVMKISRVRYLIQNYRFSGVMKPGKMEVQFTKIAIISVAARMLN